MQEKVYLSIDLKSFYASVECVERGLDPLKTNLVVADSSRTEKTICLAVSPSLKAYGISGRARLFEVVQRVGEINAGREQAAPGKKLTHGSFLDEEIRSDPACRLEYITAPPRMSRYMECSSAIYGIYLKYIAPEDIHVYSVDEVFMDVTGYLSIYGMTPRELAMTMINDVLRNTGITATAGIGTNLYLSKIAMDIVAKHMPADENGVRIAELNELSYRRLLWDHTPITDFWRVGRGYAKKLAEKGLLTMGDIAGCSIGKETDFYNEELLYRMFGVNAELLIDHAWGWENCTIADIKAYRPETNSISSGQVLPEPYSFEKGRLIIKEMTDLLVLDLVDKCLVTDQLVITIGYDVECLTDPEIRRKYKGPVTTDYYGRSVPKHAHGTVNLKKPGSSTEQILEAVTGLYDRVVNPDLLIRRLNVTAAHVVRADSIKEKKEYEQLDLFTDYEARLKEEKKQAEKEEKEHRMQEAMLEIKKRYGKNAVLKGMNFEEGGTAIQRNGQVGGHKA